MINVSTRGKYICIDGGDGAGKGTHIESLKKILAGDSINPGCFIREPGGTPLAEEIRKLLLSDEFGLEMHSNTRFALFVAARSDLIQRVILPSLTHGFNVISDRDKASTFAYQVRGDDRPDLYQLFHHIHAIVCQGANPDLYVYLDVDPEIGTHRTMNRGDANHFDTASLDKKRLIRDAYLEYFRDAPSFYKGTKVKIIDANRPIEVVGAEFLEVILEELNIKSQAVA